MANEGENLGTATIYLTVDKTSMDATIGKAKLQLAGMGAEASKQYDAMSVSQQKLAQSLVKQAEAIGKTRAEQIAYNAQLKIGGALGDEIAAKALAQAQATTAAQQEVTAATKATADAQAEMAAAEDARFKQIAADAMAEVEARNAITAATMDQARANAALAEANSVGAAGGAAYMGALDSTAVQQQMADYAALDAIMGKKVATTEEVAAAEAALDSLQAEGMISNEQLAETIAQLDVVTAAETKSLQANSVAQVENAAATTMNSRTQYELGIMLGEIASGNINRLKRSGAALANSTGLLQAIMTPTGLAITGVVAALGSLVVAAEKGEAEFSDFNRTMAATGDYAGITYTQYRGLVQSLAGSGISIGTAKDALNALAATGKFSGDQLGQAAQAAIDMAKLTGQSIDQAVASITKLAADPVKAIEALDDQYHFLSTATLQRIADLEAQGDKQDAANLAEQTYADALRSRATDMEKNLGTLQSVWQSLGQSASWAWDQMQGLGRPTTKLDDLGAQYDKLLQFRMSVQDRLSGNGTLGDFLNAPDAIGGKSTSGMSLQEQLAAIDAEMAKIRGDTKPLQDAANAAAQSKADAAALQQAGNEGVETLAKLGIGLDGVKTKADKVKEAATALWNVWRAGGQLPKGVSFTGPIADVPVGPGWDAIKSKLLSDGHSRKPKDNSDKLRQMALDDFQKEIEAQGKLDDAQQKSADEVKAFTANLDAQLQTRKQVLALQVAEVGMGTKEAQQQQELLTLQQQYESKQAQLDREHADHSRGMTDEAYAEESAALKAHYDADVALTKQHYAEMDQAQANWVNGAIAAMQNWADQGANVADQTKSLFTDAFTQMNDALVNFVQTGKLSFSQLADSIIADLVRMELRIVESKILQSILGMFMTGPSGANMGYFGSYSQSATDATAGSIVDSIYNAKGGVYNSPSLSRYSGGVYDSPQFFKFASGGVFGEAGPEAIMPLSRGSDGKLGVKAAGGGNTTVIVENHSDNKAQVQQSKDSNGGDIIRVIVGQAVSEVDKRIARGGSTSQVLQQAFGLSRRGIPVAG